MHPWNKIVIVIAYLAQKQLYSKLIWWTYSIRILLWSHQCTFTQLCDLITICGQEMGCLDVAVVGRWSTYQGWLCDFGSSWPCVIYIYKAVNAWKHMWMYHMCVFQFVCHNARFRGCMLVDACGSNICSPLVGDMLKKPQSSAHFSRLPSSHDISFYPLIPSSFHPFFNPS